MSKYSIFHLVKHAFSGHKHWPAAWENAQPKSHYEVVIIGGGGHGLATAYYLAKKYGIKDVLVLDKGWLGGGNTARNTSVIRSNYLRPESALLYDHSLKAWEGLSQELNYNVMFSPRGVVNLLYSAGEVNEMYRRAEALALSGIAIEMLSVNELKAMIPMLNTSRSARFPIIGGAVQRGGGIARHDAVAWGFARGASQHGVDIVQNCAVQGFRIENNTVKGVKTPRGEISARKIAICAGGATSILAALAGVRLPIESFTLQAFVSEPLKPVLDCVINSSTVHTYLSQTDKGELVIGSKRDNWVSYGQRGSVHRIEDAVAAMLEIFPTLSRVKLLRSWGGSVDVTPDTSPIIGKLEVKNLYINGGWGTTGFKAVPGTGDLFAHTLAHEEAHPLLRPFGLDRFYSGRLIDESAATGVRF